MTIRIQQKPSFKRAYRKLHANQREIVDGAIRSILADPLIGQEKKGNLAGVFVHKFDCVNQLFLLAYRWDEESRDLLGLGPHENFYRDLARD